MEDALEFALAKKGKRRPQTNRHGYIGEWQEPKLLTIYVVATVATGREQQTSGKETKKTGE